MSKPAPPKREEVRYAYFLPIPPELHRAMQKAADAENLPLVAWARKILADAAACVKGAK